jgi:1-deoxy-D-xylulose-5-phosphate synthase
VAIRWPKTPARSVPDDEVGHGLHARRLRSGSDVCLLAVGKLVASAEEAAALLAADGIAATVWDVRVVKPLDPAMIEDAAAHPAVVTVEDGLCEGGAGSALHHAIAELAAAEDRSAPPVTVLGTPVGFIAHGKPDAILADLGLDGAGIAARARSAVRDRSLEPS